MIPTPKTAIGSASCIPAEFNAIPCAVSRGPKISGTIAWRVGMSTANGAEARNASRKTNPKPSTLPDATLITTAVVRAITTPSDCAVITTRRRSNRSATAPETKLKINAPSPRIVPTAPTRMMRESSSAFS